MYILTVLMLHFLCIFLRELWGYLGILACRLGFVPPSHDSGGSVSVDWGPKLQSLIGPSYYQCPNMFFFGAKSGDTGIPPTIGALEKSQAWASCFFQLWIFLVQIS